MSPKMVQTVLGSLFKAPCVQPGERLLIRGETTSVRVEVATIAKKHGAPLQHSCHYRAGNRNRDPYTSRIPPPCRACAAPQSAAH
jgi:hypothetical protein